MELNKQTKLSTAKPTEFSCILKVSKQLLGTKPYQVHIVNLRSEVDTLYLTGFILERGFAGFPLVKKIYIGASSGAHKIVPKNKC